MGNLGFFEILLIGFATLILFGPDKLPELARRLGKFSADLKKTSDSVRREFYNSLYTPAETLKSEVDNVKRELRAVSEMHPLCPDTPRPPADQPSCTNTPDGNVVAQNSLIEETPPKADASSDSTQVDNKTDESIK